MQSASLVAAIAAPVTPPRPSPPEPLLPMPPPPPPPPPPQPEQPPAEAEEPSDDSEVSSEDEEAAEKRAAAAKRAKRKKTVLASDDEEASEASASEKKKKKKKDKKKNKKKKKHRRERLEASEADSSLDDEDSARGEQAMEVTEAEAEAEEAAAEPDLCDEGDDVNMDGDEDEEDDAAAAAAAEKAAEETPMEYPSDTAMFPVTFVPAFRVNDETLRGYVLMAVTELRADAILRALEISQENPEAVRIERCFAPLVKAASGVHGAAPADGEEQQPALDAAPVHVCEAATTGGLRLAVNEYVAASASAAGSESSVLEKRKFDVARRIRRSVFCRNKKSVTKHQWIIVDLKCPLGTCTNFAMYRLSVSVAADQPLRLFGVGGGDLAVSAAPHPNLMFMAGSPKVAAVSYALALLPWEVNFVANMKKLFQFSQRSDAPVAKDSRPKISLRCLGGLPFFSQCSAATLQLHNIAKPLPQYSHISQPFCVPIPKDFGGMARFGVARPPGSAGAGASASIRTFEKIEQLSPLDLAKLISPIYFMIPRIFHAEAGDKHAMNVEIGGKNSNGVCKSIWVDADKHSSEMMIAYLSRRNCGAAIRSRARVELSHIMSLDSSMGLDSTKAVELTPLLTEKWAAYSSQLARMHYNISLDLVSIAEAEQASQTREVARVIHFNSLFGDLFMSVEKTPHELLCVQALGLEVFHELRRTEPLVPRMAQLLANPVSAPTSIFSLHLPQHVRRKINSCIASIFVPWLFDTHPGAASNIATTMFPGIEPAQQCDAVARVMGRVARAVYNLILVNKSGDRLTVVSFPASAGALVWPDAAAMAKVLNVAGSPVRAVALNSHTFYLVFYEFFVAESALQSVLSMLTMSCEAGDARSDAAARCLAPYAAPTPPAISMLPMLQRIVLARAATNEAMRRAAADAIRSAEAVYSPPQATTERVFDDATGKWLDPPPSRHILALCSSATELRSLNMFMHESGVRFFDAQTIANLLETRSATASNSSWEKFSDKYYAVYIHNAHLLTYEEMLRVFLVLCTSRKLSAALGIAHDPMIPCVPSRGGLVDWLVRIKQTTRLPLPPFLHDQLHDPKTGKMRERGAAGIVRFQPITAGVSGGIDVLEAQIAASDRWVEFCEWVVNNVATEQCCDAMWSDGIVILGGLAHVHGRGLPGQAAPVASPFDAMYYSNAGFSVSEGSSGGNLVAEIESLLPRIFFVSEKQPMKNFADSLCENFALSATVGTEAIGARRRAAVTTTTTTSAAAPDAHASAVVVKHVSSDPFSMLKRNSVMAGENAGAGKVAVPTARASAASVSGLAISELIVIRSAVAPEAKRLLPPFIYERKVTEVLMRDTDLIDSHFTLSEMVHGCFSKHSFRCAILMPVETIPGEPKQSSNSAAASAANMSAEQVVARNIDMNGFGRAHTTRVLALLRNSLVGMTIVCQNPVDFILGAILLKDARSALAMPRANQMHDFRRDTLYQRDLQSIGALLQRVDPTCNARDLIEGNRLPFGSYCASLQSASMVTWYKKSHELAVDLLQPDPEEGEGQ